MAHSYTENRKEILDIIKSINPKTILDIGIGAGDYGELIRKELPGVKLIGLDVWEEYKTDKWDNYDEIIIGDMRELELPQVDLTLFIDSLEHVNKEDGLAIISKLKNPALFSIPTNYIQPPDVDFYDLHRSEWTLDDFKGKFDNYSNTRSIIILWYPL